MKNNVINLTHIRYNKKGNGLSYHEFGEIHLDSSDVNAFNKLKEFCRENNINMSVVITRKVLYDGDICLMDETPNTVCPLEEYENKLDNANN